MRAYDLKVGFTLDLILSRDGRRVAFSPCCRETIPQLVIVPVEGGAPLDPMANHSRITVSGIGWSPDGKRIAVEGITGTYPRRIKHLWTIRPDGTGLQHILRIGPLDELVFTNDTLAWTRAGILYSDGRHLRVARRGESRLVLRRVSEVRISGDGRSIVTTRYPRGERFGDRSVWIGRSDGTGQRRLFRNEPGQGAFYRQVTPSFDGSSLLAVRETPGNNSEQYDVVTWDVDEGPDSATVVAVAGDNVVATWN